jgi:hypothetical protein
MSLASFYLGNPAMIKISKLQYFHTEQIALNVNVISILNDARKGNSIVPL